MLKLKTKPRNLLLLEAIHRKAGKHGKSNKAKRKSGNAKNKRGGTSKNTFDYRFVKLL